MLIGIIVYGLYKIEIACTIFIVYRLIYLRL